MGGEGVLEDYKTYLGHGDYKEEFSTHYMLRQEGIPTPPLDKCNVQEERSEQPKESE